MKTVDYHGLECVPMGNDRLSLLVTVSVGPRVISLRAADGENVFAELPEATLDCPGIGPFHFYGGHRLWHAPEVPRVTYLPDDLAVEATEMPDGYRFTQATQPQTGLQKELHLGWGPGAATVEVTHVIWNRGDAAVRLAPWAITQLRPGGVAILPLRTGGAGDNPSQPDRSLALWPYTDVDDSRIVWGNDTIQLRSTEQASKVKVGFPNPPGWLAYWREGALFVKRAAFDPDATYADRNSSSQCYCDGRFLELETLGPLVDLRPGERTEHVETWEIAGGVPWTDDLEAILSHINRG